MQDLWKKYFSTVHMMMRFYSIQCLQCVNKEMKIIAVKASAVLRMQGKARKVYFSMWNVECFI